MRDLLASSGFTQIAGSSAASPICATGAVCMRGITIGRERGGALPAFQARAGDCQPFFVCTIRAPPPRATSCLAPSARAGNACHAAPARRQPSSWPFSPRAATPPGSTANPWISPFSLP